MRRHIGTQPLLAGGAAFCALANILLTYKFGGGSALEMLDLIIYSPISFTTFYLVLATGDFVAMRGSHMRGALRLGAFFIVFAVLTLYFAALAFALIGGFFYFLLTYISPAGASRFSAALLAAGGIFAALPAVTASLILVGYRMATQGVRPHTNTTYDHLP